MRTRSEFINAACPVPHHHSDRRITAPTPNDGLQAEDDSFSKFTEPISIFPPPMG